MMQYLLEWSVSQPFGRKVLIQSMNGADEEKEVGRYSKGVKQSFALVALPIGDTSVRILSAA